MSTLQVANLHLESTGNNRIHYTGSNTVVITAGGSNVIVANSSTIDTTGSSIKTGNVLFNGVLTGNVFPGVLLANATISTNVSTIAFTGFVNNSVYSTYLVTYHNILASLNTTQFRVKILDTNGTSLGSNIQYVGVNQGWGGLGSGSGAGVTAVRLSVTHNVGEYTSGSFYLNIVEGAQTYVVGSGVNTTNSTAGYLNTYAGRALGNTGGIEFSDSNNGTFSAGSIYIYGIKK